MACLKGEVYLLALPDGQVFLCIPYPSENHLSHSKTRLFHVLHVTHLQSFGGSFLQLCKKFDVRPFPGFIAVSYRAKFYSQRHN
jgi:hypothetical protein